jgi:sugar phosphate isomerase/epimerase
MIELSVSNILNCKGFGLDSLDAFLSLLKKYDIKGIELALNCVFSEPTNISQHELDRLRTLLEKYSVITVSLHSLTFTRPELELFNNTEGLERLIEYISAYVLLARKLDCRNIVFGSGKARKTYEKTQEECNAIFNVFLKEIDSICENIFFNIEPLPKIFCEYLNSYNHAFNILEKGNFKNIGIQLDLKSLFETDSFQIHTLLAKKDFFHHVHVSNIDFSPPSEKDFDKHRKMIDFLNNSEFDGFVSMEAIARKSNITLAEIEMYLTDFKKIYSFK